MLGAWPEPFGLVAIESMATGTPVIARRAGALPEIIEHGHSGFLVDDLQEAVLAVEQARTLDRRRIRHAAARRFSVERMIDDYERVYREQIGAPERGLVGDAAPPAAAVALTPRRHIRETPHPVTAGLDGPR
jgi:glycogen synthase